MDAIANAEEVPVDAFELARWQFAITTIFHFLFVPLSIGLAFITAIPGDRLGTDEGPRYLRMTKFWGKLFLVNFALGVVTGIVQEFQFGMNWSAYSRFVGDIFGAPLAIEGLAAFFLESTFIGLWIFGWDRLSPRLHAATMWVVAFGTCISAFFILAERVDAAPRRLRAEPRDRPRRAHRLLRAHDEHHGMEPLRAHDPGGARPAGCS